MDTCILVDDFENVCRICMKFDKIFLSINSFKITDMIIACASVQIYENDDLPNQICNSCFLQLQNTISFKQLCENSDNAFRQIIEQKKINLSNNENDLDNVKDEEFRDYVNDNSPINIKEETISEITANENILENEYKSELSRVKIRNKFKEESEEEDEDIKDDENVIETFTCEKCNKEFKRAWVLGQHMHRSHRAKALKCSQCQLKCYHPLHLREHEELVHNPLNHTCEKCNRKFSDVYNLKRHKLTHSSRSHDCQRCDQSFKDKWTLKNHNRQMHSNIEKYVACHICGKSISKKNLKIHLEIHKERDKITCDICLKTFLRTQSLKNHVKRVHENQAPERNHLCSVCGHAVRSPAQLRLHLLIHTQERPYACDRCDKTYRRSDALKEHVSRVHFDERNFVCTFCSQAFYDKKILLNHVRRHTGEKPFKCQVCDKAFIQKAALRIHTKIHTNSTQIVC